MLNVLDLGQLTDVWYCKLQHHVLCNRHWRLATWRSHWK
jgi:hypothetical protein